MKKIGIVGASGITGGELLRILRYHPRVEILFAFSRTYPGKPVQSVHPDITEDSVPLFTDTVNPEADVVFLCLGHGNAIEFLKNNTFSKHTKIIDLSRDFRPELSSTKKTWVYGLPENNRLEIAKAQFVANPGCFATAIQLALLPLAHHKELQNDVHVHAITGSTGAGNSLVPTTHFNWRNNNISWYKPFTHQHLSEIKASLHQLDPKSGPLYFLPFRGNFTRGIMASAYTKFQGNLDDALERYSKFYSNCPFTKIVTNPPDLKQVVNTNFCHLHLLKHEDVLLITSVLDNLIKGASGQAVQNMNLMLGFEEGTGLNLKASVY